jgi:hypothetical protein
MVARATNAQRRPHTRALMLDASICPLGFRLTIHHSPGFGSVKKNAAPPSTLPSTHTEPPWRGPKSPQVFVWSGGTTAGFGSEAAAMSECGSFGQWAPSVYAVIDSDPYV